jgi:hypothetical protein
MVAKPRTVHRDGIHFEGLRYFDPTLAAYVGEPVLIRYDPRDVGEIRVFHRNAFLCRAVSPDQAAQSVSLKDIQTARVAYRRRLRSEINYSLSEIKALSISISIFLKTNLDRGAERFAAGRNRKHRHEQMGFGSINRSFFRRARVRIELQQIARLTLQFMANGGERRKAHGPRLARFEDGKVGHADAGRLGQAFQAHFAERQHDVKSRYDPHDHTMNRASSAIRMARSKAPAIT